ncbi:MAG: GlmU family protein [Crocinitomicaceae bacterium]|nr:GlmU family protein [Crocinitomicaceae bacterium]
MNIIFDDNKLHLAFAPLTLTRPVAELRVGILTISESWVKMCSKHLDVKSVEYVTEGYLENKFEPVNQTGIKIAGNIKPTEELVQLVCNLQKGEQLYVNGKWVATFGVGAKNKVERTLDEDRFWYLTKPWHLFQINGQAIREDFKLLTEGRTTQQLSGTNRVIGKGDIFIEDGAKIECAILNTENGPIYIGKDAEVMEGAVIRGPFALGEHAVIKMSAKIYGDTTIGMHCKIGGEVTNSIFTAYSNKGHDGFVGNSVIGDWCNLGADTNTSNLKNNYSNVRVYSYETMEMEETGVMFCGVIMGDHSKTSINTMLNTASSIGVCANIFGNGFPPKYVPSFSWGAIHSNEKFKLEKAFEVAENMMKRRNVALTKGDKNILSYLYEHLA